MFGLRISIVIVIQYRSSQYISANVWIETILCKHRHTLKIASALSNKMCPSLVENPATDHTVLRLPFEGSVHTLPLKLKDNGGPHHSIPSVNIGVRVYHQVVDAVYITTYRKADVVVPDMANTITIPGAISR